jgi:hypothetical protein
VPSDWQQQDTYYIVAHFHYVLFGGAIMGLFAGIYYWWPKVTGRLLNDTIGKWHFWLMLIGFNLTFAPMHFLGLNGMPRRIFTYPPNMGWELWNVVATVGAFTIALSILVFMYNVVLSLRRGEIAGNDPWDGRTLEWAIPSPPPVYNFRAIPTVHGRDAYWLEKHPHPHGAERQEAAELTTRHLEVDVVGRHVATAETGPHLPGMGGEGEVVQVDRAAVGDRRVIPSIVRGLGAIVAGAGIVLAVVGNAALGLTLFAVGFLVFAVFGLYAAAVSGGGPTEPPEGWRPDESPDSFEDAHHLGIHLPDPSIFPIITGVGLTLFAAGVIFGLWLSGIGVVMMIFGIYAWCFEPING